MGELNESIHDDLAAGQCFARAAEYFKEDGNSEASATKCLLKVADYAAMDKQYAKAIEIYEEVCVCVYACARVYVFVCAHVSVLVCLCICECLSASE